MTPERFRDLVARAMPAPSVHTTQPARWRLDMGTVMVGADLACGLAAADPEGRDAALSCGAAVEGVVPALSEAGTGAGVIDLWADDDRTTLPGCSMAARIVPAGTTPADPLARMLERRFTHRGTFVPADVTGWTRDDTVPEHVAQKWEPVLRSADVQDQQVRAYRVNSNECDML